MAPKTRFDSEPSCESLAKAISEFRGKAARLVNSAKGTALDSLARQKSDICNYVIRKIDLILTEFNQSSRPGSPQRCANDIAMLSVKLLSAISLVGEDKITTLAKPQSTAGSTISYGVKGFFVLSTVLAGLLSGGLIVGVGAYLGADFLSTKSVELLRGENITESGKLFRNLYAQVLSLFVTSCELAGVPKNPPEFKLNYFPTSQAFLSQTLNPVERYLYADNNMLYLVCSSDSGEETEYELDRSFLSTGDVFSFYELPRDKKSAIAALCYPYCVLSELKIQLEIRHDNLRFLKSDAAVDGAREVDSVVGGPN